MNLKDCIFCQLAGEKPVIENKHFYGIFDKYPVSPGHLLIIPKRHAETLFALEQVERAVLFGFIEQAQDLLIKQFSPSGFNFGVNQGISAGQTISHLHIHLIPRYAGDMADPEGGIRGVIPEKQKYRSR